MNTKKVKGLAEIFGDAFLDTTDLISGKTTLYKYTGFKIFKRKSR